MDNHPRPHPKDHVGNSRAKVVPEGTKGDSVESETLSQDSFFQVMISKQASRLFAMRESEDFLVTPSLYRTHGILR